MSVPRDGMELDTIGQRKGPRHFRRTRKQGVLGLDVLRHFVVTVDDREGLVHVDVPR